MRRRIAIRLGLAFMIVAAWRHCVLADTRIYTIAIGNNEPPASAAQDLGRLRYADDDAAAFFAFARPLSVRAELLSEFDADSQRRFPDLVALAHAPTSGELFRLINQIQLAMAVDISEGNKPVLLFFFSGHGMQESEGAPAALALRDGGLTRKQLYEELFAALPGAVIHLLIDACYAEDVVRPRDLQLKVADASEPEIQRLLAQTTLAQFPGVGAILAASTNGQTHEWDLYHQGVFTHELLSGLRGAADVNDDGQIEYSELTAFLAAANRGVTDSRVRLRVISHPPSSDRRLAIVDLRRLTHALRLRFSDPAPPYFLIEDRHGSRLVELRSEREYHFAVYLPAGEPLYLTLPDRSVEFSGRAGDSLEISQLQARPTADLRPRGAMAAALRQGLFAASFGPSYYRGFVDNAPTMVSVDFRPERTPAAAILLTQPGPDARTKVLDGKVIAMFSSAALLGAAAVTFEALAIRARQEYDATNAERTATGAKRRFDRDQTLAAVAGTSALVTAGLGGWMVWRRQVAAAPAATVVGGPSVLGATATLWW